MTYVQAGETGVVYEINENLAVQQMALEQLSKYDHTILSSSDKKLNSIIAKSKQQCQEQFKTLHSGKTITFQDNGHAILKFDGKQIGEIGICNHVDNIMIIRHDFDVYKCNLLGNGSLTLSNGTMMVFFSKLENEQDAP